MIRLIGSENCGRCEITKRLLDGRGIEYTYEYMSDLQEEEQTELTKMAEQTGLTQMPLILKNNKLTDMREI